LLWKFRFLYLAAAVTVAIPVAVAQAGPSSTVGRETPTFGPPAPAPAQHRDLLAEVIKQAAEQPLHFVMSAGPIWLSRCLTAVPWYGWAMVPALAYREWRQWPSKRWWDPLLDAAFLVLGVLTATWSARPPLLFAMLRRRERRIALAQLHEPLNVGHARS
jgi:hypothetical protein